MSGDADFGMERRGGWFDVFDIDGLVRRLQFGRISFLYKVVVYVL